MTAVVKLRALRAAAGVVVLCGSWALASGVANACILMPAPTLEAQLDEPST